MSVSSRWSRGSLLCLVSQYYTWLTIRVRTRITYLNLSTPDVYAWVLIRDFDHWYGLYLLDVVLRLFFDQFGMSCWRLFSILVLHLTWLDKTVPSCVKCIINFSRMLYILENGALQKYAYLCIDIRVGDMTRQVSTVRSCWAVHAALQTSV